VVNGERYQCSTQRAIETAHSTGFREGVEAAAKVADELAAAYEKYVTNNAAARARVETAEAIAKNIRTLEPSR
jgi:plasmid stabilization system protein ParE